RPAPAVHQAGCPPRPVLDAGPAAVPVLVLHPARRRHPRHVRLGRGTLRVATARRPARLSLATCARPGGPMSNFQNLADLPLLQIWGDTVTARRVQGERITLAIVELEPNAVVAEHRHAAEQLGMVIRGQMHFTVDGETRDLGPGGTWPLLGDPPPDALARPGG